MGDESIGIVSVSINAMRIQIYRIGSELGRNRSKPLWLSLPEWIPIWTRVGVVDGRKPLGEAVAELLGFLGNGRLAPYPSPK